MGRYSNRRGTFGWEVKKNRAMDKGGSLSGVETKPGYGSTENPRIYELIKKLIVTFQLKFAGIDFVLNRKVGDAPRELLMLRLWDVKMFGFIYGEALVQYSGTNTQIFGFHFLSCIFIYSSQLDKRWIWDYNKKIMAIVLTIAGFVLMNFWAGAYLPSIIVSIVPIWDVVSLSSLTLTSGLISYRAFVSCLEIVTSIQNFIFSCMDRLDPKDDIWQAYCRNFLHYRIWLFVAIIPAIIVHSNPIIYVLASTIAISILDAGFSEESILTLVCDPLGICFRVFGYVKSVIQGYDEQFSIIALDLFYFLTIDLKLFTPQRYNHTLSEKYLLMYEEHLNPKGMGYANDGEGIVNMLETAGITLA